MPFILSAFDSVVDGGRDKCLASLKKILYCNFDRGGPFQPRALVIIHSP